MGYIGAAQLRRLAQAARQERLRRVPAARARREAARREGRAHVDPGRAGARAEGIRRRARLLLRELQPPQLRRGDRAGRRIRAGQPFALARATCCAGCTTRSASRRASWCASWPARSGTWRSTCAAARPASAAGRASKLDAVSHRMLWIPPGFAHGFVVLSEQAEVHLQGDRFLRARARAHAALERSRARHPLAARGRAGDDGQGPARRAAGRRGKVRLSSRPRWISST